LLQKDHVCLCGRTQQVGLGAVADMHTHTFYIWFILLDCMSLHSNGVRMPHVYHQSPWPITRPCSHALAHSPRVLNIRSHVWTRREAGVHAHAAVSTMTRRNASTVATLRTTQPLPTVPPTMRAMVLPEPGPPGTMVERELPVRRPGDGEVLVRVDACAVAYVAPIRCACCQRPLTHN